MWAFLLIIGLCFFGAHHYRKRITALKSAEELHAEILSWNQYTGWRNQAGWKYYELIVRAENGGTYKIVTDNSKAKKYKNRTDVTILVPPGALSAEEAGQSQTPVEVSQSMIPAPSAVTIKEAAEKPWNYWFLLIAGIVFSLLFAIGIASAIAEYAGVL